MALDEVIEMLKEEYERAKKQRYKKPLACALYRVWKKVYPLCELKH